MPKNHKIRCESTAFFLTYANIFALFFEKRYFAIVTYYFCKKNDVPLFTK